MMPTDMTAWQPIETAPKDEEILLFTPEWGAIIACYDSEFEQWLSRMQCPVTIPAETEQPTHWMALPQPPEGHDPQKLRGSGEIPAEPKLGDIPRVETPAPEEPPVQAMA